MADAADRPSAAAVGDRLPGLVAGPITRGTLALFAGASHDHALLHIDSDYVRAAGMDDVFAHGMLSMAYLSRMLTAWAPQERLRSLDVRFVAITPLHATVHCTGEVIEILEKAGERLARVRIGAATGDGVATLRGEALVALDP